MHQKNTKTRLCVLHNFQVSKKHGPIINPDRHTKNTLDRHESRSIWTAVAIPAPQWKSRKN